MYNRFLAESFVIRCPHVQYTMPALQCVRHALHCNFGSTLIISHGSVFPAATIATFDFALKGLNGRCCSRSFWIASFCGWLSIFWIKSRMLQFWERFTASSGMLEMLKSMFSTSVERLNLSASSRFLRWQSSCTVCNLSSPSGFPDPSWFRTCCSSFVSGFPGLSEELSSSCNLPTISWVTGCPVRSSMV